MSSAHASGLVVACGRSSRSSRSWSLSPGRTRRRGRRAGRPAARPRPRRPGRQQPTATAPSAPPAAADEIGLEGRRARGRREADRGREGRHRPLAGELRRQRRDPPARLRHHSRLLRPASRPASSSRRTIEGVFELESHAAEHAGKEPLVGRLVVEPVVMLVIAHGIVGRTDLPIPEWLFGWAAAVVLVVSFVGAGGSVAAAEAPGRRRSAPLPGGTRRGCSPAAPVEILCGAVGRRPARARGLTAGCRASRWPRPTSRRRSCSSCSGRAGAAQRAVRRHLPGVQSVARASGARSAWVAQRAAGGPLPAPLEYPERLGHWPAAAGIFAFAVLELVASNGDKPENVAIAALVYSAPRS